MEVSIIHFIYLLIYHTYRQTDACRTSSEVLLLDTETDTFPVLN